MTVALCPHRVPTDSFCKRCAEEKAAKAVAKRTPADPAVWARATTDEVKRDAERLWQRLLELYDRGAHMALGYPSWGAYFEAEFGASRSKGYRLLAAGRAAAAVESQSPIGDSALSESQARELVPLSGDAEAAREALREAASDGPVTASKIRQAVRRVTRPAEETVDLIQLRFTIAEERATRWRAAAERDGVDFQTWAMTMLDRAADTSRQLTP